MLKNMLICHRIFTIAFQLTKKENRKTQNYEQYKRYIQREIKGKNKLLNHKT